MTSLRVLQSHGERSTALDFFCVQLPEYTSGLPACSDQSKHSHDAGLLLILRIHCTKSLPHSSMPVLQVEEMALNNIVLSQANGIKVFYPITRMFTEPLYNVTRSSNRWEGFRVMPLPEPLKPFTVQQK